MRPDQAWSLADQLGHAYSIVLEVTQREVASENVTVSQFIALAILDGFPEGLSQTAWARFQGVSRQRAHAITKALDAEGLVDVERAGRASTVTVARRGRGLVRRLQPTMSQHLAHRLGRLDGGEADELARLLDKLLAGEGRPDG